MKTFSIEAIRIFEQDLEFALADLEAVIMGVVDFEDVDVDILVEDDGSEIANLFARLADTPEEVTSAFENFHWNTRRAFRALKESLAQGALTKAVSP